VIVDDLNAPARWKSLIIQSAQGRLLSRDFPLIPGFDARRAGFLADADECALQFLPASLNRVGDILRRMAINEVDHAGPERACTHGAGH
jgi:hypothetical protein